MVKKLILTVSVGILISISNLSAQTYEIVDRYIKTATQYSQQQHFIPAAHAYKKAAEAEIKCTPPRENYLAYEYYYAGLSFFMGRLFNEAIPYFDKAIEINNRLNPSANVEILNNKALAFNYLGKQEQTHTIFKASLDIAMQSGKAKLIIFQLNFMAVRYEKWQQFETAIALNKRLIKWVKKTRNISTEIAVKNRLGQIFKTTNQKEEALHYYQAALSLSNQNDQHQTSGIILNNIGMAHSKWGNEKEALESYRKSLEKFNVINDVNNQAMVTAKIAALHSAGKKYDLALDHFDQAINLYTQQNNPSKVAVLKNNVGHLLLNQKKYQKAQTYLESALTYFVAHHKLSDTLLVYSNFRRLYVEQYEYTKELEVYQKMLAIHQTLKQSGDIAKIFNNIGERYRYLGEFDAALENLQKAYLEYSKLKDKDGMATALNNIGLVYSSTGDFNRSLENFKSALKLKEEIQQLDHATFIYNNLGLLYKKWGHLKQALLFHNKALKIAARHHRKEDMAIYLNNIGLVFTAQKNHREALRKYNSVIALGDAVNKETLFSTYNNVGLTYYYQQKYQKAIDHLLIAADINQSIGKKSDEALVLNNLGLLYEISGNYDQAEKYFLNSFETAISTRTTADISLALDNLGIMNFKRGKYKDAIKYLSYSIEKKSEIRKTASDKIRRNYLSSQIYAYKYLLASHIHLKEYDQAFDVIEKSRSLLMSEKLGLGTNSENTPATLKEVQNQLKPEEALVIYGNSGGLMEDMVVWVITQQNQSAVLMNKEKYLDPLLNRNASLFQKRAGNTRGIKLVKKTGGKVSPFASPYKNKKDRLSQVVSLYRDLLIKNNPNALSGKHQQLKKEVNTTVYRFLIEPVETLLKGKTNITIVPDTVLGILPFETLADKNNQYLVENFDIQYIHSLSVQKLIRNRTYSGQRKPLLAFGNPKYDQSLPHQTASTKELYFDLFKNRLSKYENEGNSLRRAYRDLGVKYWSELPGTLSEVKGIQSEISSADLFTNSRASEYELKKLSNTGSLKNYKTIHFATHALTVNAVPELSALVLSQFKKEKNGEDGYVRMNEISKLKIEADFINLSACETGLGKIYDGEGIIGLNQSFIIAGANSVSVSLWKVADQSTSSFMIDMYTEVEKNKISYEKAISKVKRKFINGDFGKAYKDPYYWAPFVYYGI